MSRHCEDRVQGLGVRASGRRVEGEACPSQSRLKFETQGELQLLRGGVCDLGWGCKYQEGPCKPGAANISEPRKVLDPGCDLGRSLSFAEWFERVQ